MENDRYAAQRPQMHPCLHAMIVAGGMEPLEYIDLTRDCRAYRTRADLGERDTRIVPMPALPAHTGGYTHRDEIMVSVHLREGMRFLSRAPGEGACMMVDRTLVPETLRQAAIGRMLHDIVEHPMFEVAGLLVTRFEDCGPPYPGQARIELARLPWRSAR